MKQVFVTGAFGFFGRHVARHLDSAGYRVAGLGRNSRHSGDFDAWGIKAAAVGEISGWMLEELAERVGTPDVIVHAAGTSSVWQAEQDPCIELGRTLAATSAVIEFMRKACPKTRLIYVSSAAVYGQAGVQPIKVDAPLAPLSHYGMHKHLCEQLVMQSARMFDLTTSIVRFFSLYGAGLPKQLLWDTMRRAQGTDGPLSFSGTGLETRDFLHVSDAARLVAMLIECRDLPAVVNGGSGQPSRIVDVVEKLLEGSPCFPAFSGQGRAGDPTHLVADVSEIKALGFKVHRPLTEGLAEYREWAGKQLEVIRRERGRAD